MRIIRWLAGIAALFCGLVALSVAPARAHNLPYSLATLSLRKDGVFELQLNCHLAALLMGEPQTHLSPEARRAFGAVTDREIGERSEIAAGYLRGAIAVTVNERRINTPRPAFPSVALVRADAAQTLETQAPSAPIAFQGVLPRGARRLALTFPAELGAVLLRVERPDGSHELRTIVEGAPSEDIDLRAESKPSDASSSVAFADYARLGATHILTGFDHLAFVIGLLLLTRNATALLRVITAFTVAHSLTLAATVLGWVSIPRSMTELGIALSVLWLGLEVWRGKNASARGWALVFGFGLIHGMGLAQGLSSLGLTGAELPFALLYFNIGIELGQLAIVFALIALGGAWRGLRISGASQIQRGASGAILVLGVCWTAATIFQIVLR